VTYLEQRLSWKDNLLTALADEQDDDATTGSQDAFAMLAGAPHQRLAVALTEVRSIMAGPSIQARCLECPVSTPVSIKAQDQSLLALIKEWLF
jgi:protease-4